MNDNDTLELTKKMINHSYENNLNAWPSFSEGIIDDRLSFSDYDKENRKTSISSYLEKISKELNWRIGLEKRLLRLLKYRMRLSEVK